MGTNSFSKTLFSALVLRQRRFGANMQKFGDNSNTINDKAVLEIESTTKGFSRMTKTQRGLITNPPEGLMWCTDCSLSKGSE
jgi:hypothetical protein